MSMNKSLLSLGLILLLPVVSVHVTTAEEATDMEKSWPIEQHCLGEPTPPDDWAFEGTIFTQGSGVHAIRADVTTPYYVAFSGDTEFGNNGALSPENAT